MKKRKIFKYLSSFALVLSLPLASSACQLNITNSESKNNETLSGNAKIIAEYREEILNDRKIIDEKFTKYNEIVKNNEVNKKRTVELKTAYDQAKQAYDVANEKVEDIKTKRNEVLPRLQSFSEANTEIGKKIVGQCAIGLEVSEENYSQIRNSSFVTNVKKMNELNSKYNEAQLVKVEAKAAMDNARNEYENQLAVNEENELVTKELMNDVLDLQRNILNRQKWIKNNSKNAYLSFNSIEITFKEFKKVIDENGNEKIVIVNPNEEGNSDNTNTGPIEPPDFGNIDLSKIPTYDENAHKYPDFASKYTALNSAEIYKEIYDRTFSFKYSFKESTTGPIVGDTIYQGTSWIIDYHKDSNSNKYKIFMATNMHVLGQFSNTLGEVLDKKLDSYDPTGSTVVDFSLGKTKNVPSNFGDIPNNSYKDHLNERGGDMVYFNSKNLGLEKPKLVFAAIDYINDPTLRSQVKTKKYKDKFIVDNQLELKSNDSSENQKRTDMLNYVRKLNYVPYFSDFGIFEFTVDLDSPNVNSTFKSWIRTAISALDKYILRNKTTELPNKKTTDLPFLSADYLSTGRNKLSGKHIEYQNISLANAKDVYIGGYPKSPERKTIWMQNNPTERKSTTLTSYFKSPDNSRAFAFSTGDFDSKLEAGNPNVQTILNKPVLNFYGVNYNIKFSSLYYGASGSVVYNEFGEIIGIYSAVKADNKFGNLLDNAGMTSLIQRTQLKLSNGTLYPYNLIDGTDKTLYPRQTHSYRENLRVIYPNGFDDNTKTTALFPDGF